MHCRFRFCLELYLSSQLGFILSSWSTRRIHSLQNCEFKTFCAIAQLLIVLITHSKNIYRTTLYVYVTDRISVLCLC